MGDENIDIRQLASRLTTAHIKTYLLSQGWEQKPSRYMDHLYFQGAVHEEGERYELYFPASTDVAKYHMFAMRAIYKLCGIEDREPAEIVRDVLASAAPDAQPTEPVGVAQLRVRNSDSRPLRLKIDSPSREHELLPGEAIELVCHVGGGLLEIDRGEQTITIRALEHRQAGD